MKTVAREISKIATKDIERAVVKHFDPRQNLIVPNVSWGFNIHECDLLICTRTGYLYEVEIKTSKSDLKKDLKKRHGHHSTKIRKLYFAIPEFLKDMIEFIPRRAGILIVKEDSYKQNGAPRLIVECIRKARVDSTAPCTIEEKYQLARLGALRIWRQW